MSYYTHLLLITPADSSGLRRTTAYSGGVRWSPLETGGVRWSPVCDLLVTNWSPAESIGAKWSPADSGRVCGGVLSTAKNPPKSFSQ